MTDSYAHLLVATTGDGVRTITLNRPDRLNAVNAALAEELPRAVADAGREDAVRAVVITGAGRGFCAGLDLGEPPSLPSGSRAERLDDLAWVGRWVLAMVECEKPVVAAVNGAAAGAGFGLALAADVRLVAAGARLTAGYVRRGLSPDAGGELLPSPLVGLSRAARHRAHRRDVGAEEAERIGLASRVLPAEGFAEGWPSTRGSSPPAPPLAHALTKRLLVQSLDTPLRAQLRDELTHIKSCFASRDVREAMAAFAEKRAARFGGSRGGCGV
jgi:2-(1,2-epoxy-1,2-dihydrophenyl)acetyl-CoA isomerase